MRYEESELVRRELEVRTDFCVILDFLNHRIEYLFPYMEICLEESNEFFAVIGVDPRTILDTEKTDIPHFKP